ncbi:MAG: ATP-binding protein [Desulfitobacteriaceae bacterium]
MSKQKLWQTVRQRLFPMAITKRVYVAMLALIIAPMLILALVVPLESWAARKAHRSEELYDVSFNLVQKMPGSFHDILAREGVLDKPQAEQVKVLNRVLQPIINEFSSIQPSMSMGYYSIEFDSILAIGPDFKESLLKPVPHDYPYFSVYENGKPELKYSSRSIFWGEPILNQTYPIFDQGVIVGHAWANYKMQDVAKEMLTEVRDIFLFGTMILLASIFLTWRVFRQLRSALKTFAERAADNRIAALHEDFPELNTILEMVQAHNEELIALNSHLQEEIAVRQQAEVELFQINREMSTILESISEAFFALDSDWRITYVNHEAEILLEGTRYDLVGKVIWDEIPGHEGMQEKFQLAVERKTPLRYEDYGERSHKWLEIHIYPAEDGLSVFLRDVTDRRLANEALRESEQRFFKAFHSSPSLMVIVNLENDQIIDANQSFFSFTGYERAEVIKDAQSVKFCDIFDQGYALKEQEYDDNTVRNFEIKFRTKDDQERYGLAATEKIELSGKKCLLVAIIDITERKHFEKEILRYERLSLVGQMAAGIGHEIRNPMTTVRGFLQMLSAKQDLEKYKEYFNLMIQELDRTNSIITEFLSLGSNRPVELKMQDLNTIISALAPLIEADALSGGKSLVLRLDSIPELLLSEKEIRQIVLNLARNALEAMEAGGVLAIKTFGREDEVVLAVEDNGPGIPPDVLAKIGTPFFTTKDQGTGLGLAVCYSIAARHQANITVTSSPGRTVFFVKFVLEQH